MLQTAPVLTARVEIVDDADAESPEVRPPSLVKSSCISATRPLAASDSFRPTYRGVKFVHHASIGSSVLVGWLQAAAGMQKTLKTFLDVWR